MSLCDRCFAPGQCCKRLWLSKNDQDWTVWSGEADSSMIKRGLPFRSLEVVGQFVVPDDDPDGDAGRTYETHRWRCSALSPDGRCSIYEDRPQLCRDFDAGSDQLCVHFQAAETGETDLWPLGAGE